MTPRSFPPCGRALARGRAGLVSVVVPAGRSDRVAVVVQSLRRQTLRHGGCEVIIVTPEPERLRHLEGDRVTLAPVAELLPPGAMRNIGAALAGGDALCFLDDDCLPPDDWLSRMTATLSSSPDLGAVGCRVVAARENFWDRCADEALFTSYQGKTSGYVAGLGSAALAVRRVAFTAAGGFDQELLASEDWDFSLKLRQTGWKCWFDAGVAVGHDHRRGGFLLILRAAFRSGRRSGLTVQRRHYGAVTWLARLMALFGRPIRYWLVMAPYAAVSTLLWVVEARPRAARLCACLPMVFLARCAYQLGVWRTLTDNDRP